MATITKIEQQKNKERVNIFVDGSFFCGISKETAIVFGLKVGREVEEQKLLQAVRESEIKRAFEKGADYLAGRMYAKKELIQKLVQKGFEREVAESAVTKLKSYSYIDDVAFARAFVQENPKYSLLKLETKLRAKGVDKAVIEEALKDVSDSSQVEVCTEFAKKYAKTHEVNSPSGRSKLYASLARRGFKFDTIKKACKIIGTDDEIYEDF